MIARFRALAAVGVQHVIFSVGNVWEIRNIETLGREVIPPVHDLEPATI